MKFLVKKVCNGILDTNKERKRINTAFDDEPETKKHLLDLIEVVEKMEWDKAREMIESKWWMGEDEKRECSRLEFIGILRLTDPDRPKQESIWFERMFDYMDLIYKMSDKEVGGKVYFVEPIAKNKKALKDVAYNILCNAMGEKNPEANDETMLMLQAATRIKRYESELAKLKT